MANRLLKNPCFTGKDYPYVQGVDKEITICGLALTPSQVQDMTDKGIAVSLPNQDFLDSDGSAPHDYSVELMFRRGMSREELWESERGARKSVFAARREDIKKFGD